jgi:aerobic-type carbon monoxide dehydrogenase small subunit (CoxS/CutS family)
MAELRCIVNGESVSLAGDAGSLLEVLRDRLGITSVKDGCSPQGQCGCCTVLVDGQPRVACVTPASRVQGRGITTFEGLPESTRRVWTDALCATGGTQCGFCTPGIVVRLAGRDLRPAEVRRSLLAHLCRCTGWQTIVEAASLVAGAETPDAPRDLDAAARRATLEGGSPQQVGPHVAAGMVGFADDLAPSGTPVAVRSPQGSWVVGATLAEARQQAGVIPGRRTSAAVNWPLEVPPGDWVRTLRTTWVEPAYVELDASWCEPGEEPASPLGNAGAFGAKVTSEVTEVARRLAHEYGRPVRVRFSREDAVRWGPKRPPLALGVRADGTGVVRAVRTPGLAEAVAQWAPGWTLEQVEVAGPPTSLGLRGAVWAELAAALSSLTDGPDTVATAQGARCTAWVDVDGVHVRVRAGEVLDAVVLRSYVIGAAHQALGWVRSEGLAVDTQGEVHDLTIRSFGVLRALDTPPIHVEIEPDDGPAMPVSPAVLAAVAAAVWRADGFPPVWPTGR